MSEIYDFTVCEIIIFYITIFCICQIFVISYFLIIANYFNKIEFDAKNMYKVETFFTETIFFRNSRENSTSFHLGNVQPAELALTLHFTSASRQRTILNYLTAPLAKLFHANKLTHQHILNSLNSGKCCIEYICARFESHPPVKDIHSDTSSASSRKANSPHDTVTVPTRVFTARNRARQRTSSERSRLFSTRYFS